MNYLNSLHSPLVRVSKGNPCPICSRPDWCSISADDSLVICMREEAGSIKVSKNNGYVHILNNFSSFNYTKPQYCKPEVIEAAPLEKRHQVYEALLNTLTLSSEHATNLENRGLSDTTIAAGLYSTLPTESEAVRIVGKLANFHDLNCVPGFFTDSDNRWRLFVRESGFLIPIRDVNKKIQACQLRLDDGEPRYKWFSSKWMPNGVSSFSPIHFARVWRAESTGEMVITEGALKADIIAEKLDCCVIGVPGVSSFNAEFGSWLKQQLPMITNAYIAYDLDWREKLPVKNALSRLTDSLMSAGLNGEMLVWEGAKGLDDLYAVEVLR